MGNAETWHGSPDFRIGCVCVLSGYELFGKATIEKNKKYSTPTQIEGLVTQHISLWLHTVPRHERLPNRCSL